MNLDERRYQQCLRKKPLTEAEADMAVYAMRHNQGGRLKGKRKKLGQRAVKYLCMFCQHYHVGHQKYKTPYDPLKEIKKRLKGVNHGLE